MTLLLLLCACLGGALLACRLDERSDRLIDALALGTALGLALLAALGFLMGWAFGLSPGVVVASAAFVLALGLMLGAKPSALWARRRARPSAGVLLLTLFCVALVARLAERTLIETPGGIATGAKHNFGDLPFHMSIAAGFAYGDNFPPEHPELAGQPLTYPFFGDVISGMMLAIGGSWRDAFLWPALLLGLSVIVTLVRFGETVTGSRALGRVAAALTFFSGGLGFVALTSADGLSRWWTSGPDLTIAEEGIRYANFIITLFIPQRSILFGWPLLFFALTFIVESIKASDGERASVRAWVRAGIVGSLLPLVHAHSFAGLCFCAVVLAAIVRPKAVLSFIAGVSPLAVPAVLFMMTHNSLSTGRFFEWKPGFDGGQDNPLAYWLMNAGLFLPLVAIGLMRAKATSVRTVFALPFVTLFLAANLFRLSPWIWDNMKFLAPAHAGLAPFAALALGLVWAQGPIGKALGGMTFGIAILSGALDVSKIVFESGTFQIFQSNDLLFALKIRETTPTNLVVLTAPAHNHPVLLSGRRLFLGYDGHLWSQGLSYTYRKPIAEGMFKGGSQASASIDTPRVGAIAITPHEAGLVDSEALQGLPSFVDSPYRLVRVR